MLTKDFFRDIEWLFDVPAGKEVRRYPLTDLSYDKNTVYVDIAVAGFGPDDIDIELENDTLIIEASESSKESRDGAEYIQKHISTSPFVRKVRLHPDFIGGDIEASYKDGILSIKVTKKEKPKKLIEIKKA